MLLHQIPHIKLNVDINVNKTVAENELGNCFRLFKQSEESLEGDCVYSPFFDSPNLFVLGDDYANRMYLYNILREKLPDKCTKLHIDYDFTFTPVCVTYTTEGEYLFIGTFLDLMLKDTNLSLLFFVSHFNQFGNKAGTFLKPEHFHAYISGEKEDIKIFVNNLKGNDLINKVTVKE